MRHHKRTGRPATRPEGLEPFTAHLTKEAKTRLKALAQIEGEHAYKIVEQAFWRHWQALPAAKREAAEAIISLVDKARGGSGR